MSKREGRYNSLNFNWIEIMASAREAETQCCVKYPTLEIFETKNILKQKIFEQLALIQFLRQCFNVIKFLDYSTKRLADLRILWRLFSLFKGSLHKSDLLSKYIQCPSKHFDLQLNVCHHFLNIKFFKFKNINIHVI